MSATTITATAAPTQAADSDAAVVLRAAQKASDWLAGNCTGEPPRTSIALLATLAQEIAQAPAAASGAGQQADSLQEVRNTIRELLAANADLIDERDAARAALAAAPAAAPDTPTVRAALTQIIDADDAQTLCQQHIEYGRRALAAAPAAAQPAMQPAGWLIVSTGAGGQLCAQHYENEREAREALPHRSGGRVVPCYVPANGVPAAAQPVAYRFRIPVPGGGSGWTFHRPQPEILLETQPLYAAPQAPVAAQPRPLSGLGVAAIARKHFGNPIPREAYAFAAEIAQYYGAAAPATGEQQP